LAAPQFLAALFDTVDPVDGSDMRRFLKTCATSPSQFEMDADPRARSFGDLMHVALRADRRSAGVAAGHQAAIRRLFPSTPRDAITAFCVSEERGAHPAGIETSLSKGSYGKWTLDGSKKWGSMSPDADILYVAASVGKTDTRNDLRMVALPADRAGLELDLDAHPEHQSEMRIADLTFRNIQIDQSEIIDGDAYLNYIKPFRLVEDVFGTAGTQIALIKLGMRHNWDEQAIEDLLALVGEAAVIAQTGMETPEEVLLISAYLRRSAQVWDSLGDCWKDVPPDIVKKWRPDVGMLGVAARAREMRRDKAWQELRRNR